MTPIDRECLLGAVECGLLSVDRELEPSHSVKLFSNVRGGGRVDGSDNGERCALGRGSLSWLRWEIRPPSLLRHFDRSRSAVSSGCVFVLLMG